MISHRILEVRAEFPIRELILVGDHRLPLPFIATTRQQIDATTVLPTAVAAATKEPVHRQIRDVMTTASLGDSETLRDSYLRNVAIYEKILANDKADDGAKQPFWDVLIITASDEQQCRHYETGGRRHPAPNAHHRPSVFRQS